MPKRPTYLCRTFWTCSSTSLLVTLALRSRQIEMQQSTLLFQLAEPLIS